MHAFMCALIGTRRFNGRGASLQHLGVSDGGHLTAGSGNNVDSVVSCHINIVVGGGGWRDVEA